MLCSVVGYRKGWLRFHPQQPKIWHMEMWFCVPLCFKNHCWFSLTVIFWNAFHSNYTDDDDASINFPRHFPNHGLLEHSVGERKEKKRRAKFKAVTDRVKYVKQNSWATVVQSQYKQKVSIHTAKTFGKEIKRK